MSPQDLEPLRINRSSLKPSVAARPTPRVLAAAGVILGLMLLWLLWPTLRAIHDRLRLPEVSVIRVERQHPASAGSSSGLAANGHVVAARSADLAADITGRIVEILVEEGSSVRKGQVLARIASDDFAAALARAEAEVDRARATHQGLKHRLAARKLLLEQREADQRAAAEALSAAGADLEQARLDYERTQELAASGAASQSELDRSRTTHARTGASLRQSSELLQAAGAAVAAARGEVAVGEADIDQAAAQIAAAQASHDQAQVTLAKTEINAPFAGIVVGKQAEVGEIVGPVTAARGAGGGAVVTLVDPASLEVQAEVPETSLASVSVGAHAAIYLDAWPQKPYTGRVERIWPTANRQKATVEVRVSLIDVDDRVRPEMGVRVVFGKQGDSPVLAGGAHITIPERALVSEGDSAGVFVVERDLASFRQLELGPRSSGRVVVTSGLEAGEQIILDPPASISNGSRVRLESPKS